MPTYFTPDYLKFFMELAPNNNKDWFDANRNRYKKSVKEPFEKFVGLMMEKVGKSEGINKDVKPSDCIFRVNRDIRFSKDKSPYKLQMSAAIAKGGKKDMVTPGLYFELGPEHVGIYTGIYMPDKDQIDTIRRHIAKNAARFEKIINDKNFKKSFGDIQGDKAKLLPPDLKAAAAKQPAIFNKQFYVMHRAEPDMIVEGDVAKYIVDTYKHAEAFNNFLKEVL
ncbi:MAG: DUF2461 domain-containing protein [Bacteroidota bacterium]